MPALTKQSYYRQRARKYKKNLAESEIRQRRACAWIEPRSRARILDLGCKFGQLRCHLDAREVNYSYVGLDIDEDTVLRANGSREDRFICHDLNEGIPLADATVDYAVCLELLEHIESPSTLLEEICRVLHPRGRLILSVPNPYCWMELVGNARRSADTEGHIASFTWQNIDALTNFVGLDIIDHKGSYTRVPWSKKLFGAHRHFETDHFLLTRSNMFLLAPRKSPAVRNAQKPSSCTYSS